MKKLFTFLILAGVFYACKQQSEGKASEKEGVTTVVATVKDTCISDLSFYETLSTSEAKVQWLRDNGRKVCEDILRSSVIKDHQILKKDYPNEISGTYSIKWMDLKDFLGDSYYNAYLSFDMDLSSRKIENLKLINRYKKDFCYSPVLIKSIATYHQLKDNDIFEFGFATIKDKETIVIKVKDSSFYDFSDEPKKK